MSIHLVKKSLRFLTFFLSFILLTMPCLAKPIELTLNGNSLKSTTAPITEKGSVLVPLRIISENLGATVNYDQSTKSITLIKSDTHILLTLGSPIVKVNDAVTTLQVTSKVISETTMVPLRFISENLNCQVEWIGDKNLVAITTKESTNQTLPTATLKIKDHGTVTLELYPDLAPNTVNNFIALANNGFYDGLTFHRVIENFMIQGGDPNGDGTGNPGYSIPGEFSANGFTSNTLSHTKGVISMARAYDPNSAGSQFFIMSADGTYLDGQYAAFGKVISGLSIIEKIQLVDTNEEDKPLEAIVIESIRVNPGAFKVSSPITVANH